MQLPQVLQLHNPELMASYKAFWMLDCVDTRHGPSIIHCIA